MPDPNNSSTSWKTKDELLNNITDSNVYKAYQFLTGKGLSHAQASGVVGNLAQESTINLDSSIENEVGAVGVAQWLGSRKKDLLNFAKKRGEEFTNFDTQMEFMWHEFNTSEKRAYNELLETTGVADAAEVFLNRFERSGEKKGSKGYNNRINYARQFSNALAGVPTAALEEVGEIDPIDNSSLGNILADVKGELAQSFIRGFENLKATENERNLEREQQLKESEAQARLKEKINKRDFLKEVIKTTETPYVVDDIGGMPQNMQGQVSTIFEDGGEVDPPTEKEKLAARLKALKVSLQGSTTAGEVKAATVPVDGVLVDSGMRNPMLSRKPSLEEEEKEIRTRKPEKSMLEEVKDFIVGNVDENVINPAKIKASKVLPRSLAYDPTLTTTRSEYDDTDGAGKYLLDNKSIAEIRKEKNIAFTQISNSTNSNMFLPMKFKKRILNSIYPQGYGADKDGFTERFTSPESLGNRQIKRLPGKKGEHREDIFLMYAGLPQVNDTFTASSFRAGKDSDTNVTFKDPKVLMSYLQTAAVKTNLFDKLASGEINPQSIEEANNSEQKGGEKIHKAGFRDPQNVMWNATFGIGYDGTGTPYLSFYDNWDLAGKDDNDITKGVFGSPIEIYDRIPLTPKLIKSLARKGYAPDNNGESDGTQTPTDNLVEDEFEKIYGTDDVELKEELKRVYSSLKSRMK